MADRKFGFGLVGLGNAAQSHAPQIRQLQEGVLVAVSGRNEEKAKKFAEDFGAKRWCPDCRRMLDDSDVDVVNVPAPYGLHGEVAVRYSRGRKARAFGVVESSTATDSSHESWVEVYRTTGSAMGEW